jgi:D-alanyl-D-alanine endopeptidase (penicillin-binding protein 7)
MHYDKCHMAMARKTQQGPAIFGAHIVIFRSDFILLKTNLENAVIMDSNLLIILPVYIGSLRWNLFKLQRPVVFRSALAIFFSLLHVIFVMPTALANNSSEKRTYLKKHFPNKTNISKPKNKSSLHINRHSAANSRKLIRKIISVRVKPKIRLRMRSPRVADVIVLRQAPLELSAGEHAGLNLTNDPLGLQSNAALVLDPFNSEVLFAKNSQEVLPIASITKLMTALVVVEAQQDMAEVLAVSKDDIDKLKNTSSRLRIGSKLTRANMLHIALMSSENRAASALGRHYPGGVNAFVTAMNAKAKTLGMTDTHYVEPTGLSSLNVSSARDLAKLVIRAQQHPIIRQYTTHTEYAVDPGGPVLQYRNSNRLVANSKWKIGLQKTGYISEAGHCLVMQVMIKGRSIVMVFLDAKGRFSRSSDAGRIRKWLETVKMR